MALGSY